MFAWLSVCRRSVEHGHTQAEIEARLDAPSVGGHLRDAVYGGIDGAVTTFAIVAGVAGADLSHQVIIALGVANVLADGFSMAAGNYTGIRADQDNLQRMRKMERRHIQDFPAGERQEIRTILLRKGMQGTQLDNAVQAVTSNKELWLDLMLLNEHGISPVVSAPLRSALVTFAAFMVCGFIPLLAFLLGLEHPFRITVLATGITFLLIGAVKSRWSMAHWWWSALQTLAIGSTAALIAWGAGMVISHLIS